MSGKIPEDVKARVRASARQRCGYCLAQQRYTLHVLEIEHIIAKAKGGSDDESNLWLACRLCNNGKGVQTHARDPLTGRRVKLFNPRTQSWRRHFNWSENGIEIIGRTAIGRATVTALNLNNEIALVVRRNWVRAGWHPPAL
ncbi:MAG: HNH endonuclease [Blastocatellales bacterium]